MGTEVSNPAVVGVEELILGKINRVALGHDVEGCTLIYIA